MPDEQEEKKYREVMADFWQQLEEAFVAIARASGGYPYGTDVAEAHDFKSIEAAKK